MAGRQWVFENAVNQKMPDNFQFDVFLSHSSKDKPVVRELAARLKGDGIRVWLDEEQIKPGDSIPAKIEEGLERSRVLVLCMSANAFGSDWAQLESGTFRFRDPLNKERRFLPLRLDDAPIKGSLAQFLYIDWRQNAEIAYSRLVVACQPPSDAAAADLSAEPEVGTSGRAASSSATLFLKEKVEREFDLLNRQKITPWVFFNSHGISIEGPDGRKWRIRGGAPLKDLRERYFGTTFCDPLYKTLHGAHSMKFASFANAEDSISRRQ